MLNDIDVEGLDAARKAILETPAAGAVRYGVNLVWKKGTQAEVSALPHRIGDETIERDFKWIVDEPPQLLGASSGPTPQEYLMSGVGACIMVGFVVNASVAGLKVRSLEVEVTRGLDLAGFLNLRSDAPIKMEGLHYTIRADADGTTEMLEGVARKAYEFSPNAMTVHHGVPITGRLDRVGEQP
jgi:uncharacterized OsmC-like protein